MACLHIYVCIYGRVLSALDVHLATPLLLQPLADQYIGEALGTAFTASTDLISKPKIW